MKTEFPRHILSAKQFCDRDILLRIFEEAYKFERLKNSFPKMLKDRFMLTLFYEPSTRTRISFAMAMLWLGGKVVETENAKEFSSVAKGEDLADTIRVVSGYHPDVIVLRHDEEDAAKRAAAVSCVPIINAGDGTGEHPTQMLLDLYTVWRLQKRLDDLSIAFVGDPRHGRTIHSLIYPFSNRNVCPNAKIYGVSPPELALPNKYKEIISEGGAHFEEVSSIEEVADKVDVLYMTRTQKERFKSDQLSKDAKVDPSFVVNRRILSLMKRTAIIMHPLPRNEEIPKEVDADSRAVYFKQAQYGLYVRMAILKLLLRPE